MKRKIFLGTLAFLVISFNTFLHIGCNDKEDKHPKWEYRVIGDTTITFPPTTHQIPKRYEIIVIDSCEYIKDRYSNQPLVHKANCKNHK